MNERKYRETLIFVAGQTPQIITETIFALSQKNPPVYPHEIFIITTKQGKERIEKGLIQRKILKQFAEEYHVPEIPINKNSFLIIRDKNGNELDDIRSDSDNESLSSLICSFIKEKTANDHTRLHCSIAGGRKTMSFYLGAALQLFGREQDRLYHVLVSPEFEALKDFYYKPLKDRSIEVHNDKGETIRKLNTKDAEICLSELPFVRLREKIPLTGSDIFQIVSQGQKEIDTAIIQPELNVDIEQHIIYIGDKKIEIVPNQLAFYLYFLRTKLEKCKLPGRKYCLDCTECFEETAEYTEITVVEKMSEDYDKMYGKTSIRSEKFFDKWTKEETCFDKEMVRSKISKINRTIKEELEDLTLLPFYQITSVGKHGNKKYGVRVEKGKIEIYAE